MKLHELKDVLIKDHFKNVDVGVNQMTLDRVIESFADTLELDYLHVDGLPTSISNNPIKAFRKFMEGKTSTITIAEDVGFDKIFTYVAVRTDDKIMCKDLVKGELVDTSLDAVKQVINQAENLNEEVYFSIRTDVKG